MGRRTWIGWCAALLLVVAACSSGGSDDAGDGGGGGGGSGGGEAAGWTWLQYQIGDTDLEPFLMADINEIGTVGSNDQLRVRALVDRAAEYGDSDVLDVGSWVGGKVLDIGRGKAEVVEDMGDVDTGDPQVLRDFIAQGIKDNPAERYALVLSDHGASWPGVGGDEGSDNNGLSLAEINEAITGGLDDAGVDKLDLLGFDACLMATYEVASTLAPVADRLLASAELVPGHGFNYAALQAAYDDGSVSVDELGTRFVDDYMAQAAEYERQDNVTLALLDLTKMDDVDDAMSAFTSAVIERGSTVAPQIGRARPAALGYGKSPDPSQDSFMADLGDLAARIGVEALDVSAEADALQRAINDSVVYKAQGAQTEAFSGLSVYFPPAEFMRESYSELEVPGGWQDLLRSFYTAGEALPEDQQADIQPGDDGQAQVSFDEDGLTITGTFDPAIYENIADSYISYGVVGEDGAVTYFGDESATFDEDGTAEGFFDLTQLQITDGVDTATAYVSLTSTDDTDGFTIDVPMAYYEPDELEEYVDVLLEIVVDGEGNVTQETYYVYDEDSGSYGELTADPEGIVVPDVLTVDADGNEEWTPTSDVGLFADLPELQYDFVQLQPGTQLYIELVLEDFAGNTDSVSATVTIP